MQRDPVEKTLRYILVEKKVDQEVRKKIGNGGYLGYCHRFWALKQRILKEEYGIDWKSPAEMNPDWFFD